MEYIFEWDPRKAKTNLRKHGVSFERAGQVFLDNSALSLMAGATAAERIGG